MKKASSHITVGHRPVEDFHRRMATEPNSRAITAESRDWMLVRSLLQPGEVQWVRCAVRFPHEGNASGHVFLTDRRVMFEFHERVYSISLSVITFLGVPPAPSVGDFAIEAVVPGAGAYATTMRIRDKDAFHDFFPTLHYAALSAGAQPAADVSWPGPTDRRAADVPRQRPQSEPSPAEALRAALPGFLRPGESVVASVEMIQNMTDVAMTVMLTESRLVVREGNVLWASALEDTHLVYGGGEKSHLRLLVERVDDAQTITAGPPTAQPSDERRLVLRPLRDAAAAEEIHRRLTSSGGQLFDAWPEEL